MSLESQFNPTIIFCNVSWNLKTLLKLPFFIFEIPYEESESTWDNFGKFIYQPKIKSTSQET